MTEIKHVRTKEHQVEQYIGGVLVTLIPIESCVLICKIIISNICLKLRVVLIEMIFS